MKQSYNDNNNKQSGETSTGPKARAPYNYTRGNVYRIVNILNGWNYVGSCHGYINQRFADHRCKLRKGTHSSSALQKAWDKYGEENFNFEIIVSSDVLSALEVVLMEVALIKCNEKCYNKNKSAKPVPPSRRLAISEGNKTLHPERVIRAKVLLGKGSSVTEVAHETGLSLSTVYKIKAGVFNKFGGVN